jgi:hypothetical protein
LKDFISDLSKMERNSENFATLSRSYRWEAIKILYRCVSDPFYDQFSLYNEVSYVQMNASVGVSIDTIK